MLDLTRIHIISNKINKCVQSEIMVVTNFDNKDVLLTSLLKSVFSFYTFVLVLIKDRCLKMKDHNFYYSEESLCMVSV